tara:strand:- start:752 stop:931 length:180 start_codon:yes stop_codon:yes gene_type:complete
MPGYSLKEINNKISELKKELEEWEHKKLMHEKLISNFKRGSKKKSKRKRRRRSRRRSRK